MSFYKLFETLIVVEEEQTDSSPRYFTLDYYRRLCYRCSMMSEPRGVLSNDDEAQHDPNTPLQQFYAKTSIFITGGSGFMGKVLTEKLLRVFPELDTIYLLMREKRGKTVDERMDAVFNDVLFGKLRRMLPTYRSKVRAVTGDCSLPGLGLSDEDRHLLLQNVDIVFHGAATVRFDEKLKVAVAINVNGTKDVIALAKRMDKLKAIVHLSTAYCNCPLPEIHEQFYEPPMPYEKLINLVDACPERALEGATPFLLDKWPNSYTLTKAVAEDVVRQEGPGLPIVVFRPAIVVGISYDPLPGWIDNLYGPTGVAVGAGTGVLRTLHVGPDVTADMVPVDMAVNAMLTAAWDIGTSNRAATAEAIPVYNYVSSCEQPITWGRFDYLLKKHGLCIPTMQAIWCCSFTLNKHYWVHWIYCFFLHTLTALVVDTGLKLMGKEPRLRKIYAKIDKFSDVISYFSTRNWTFTNHNVQALWLKLSDEQDKRDLMFDMKQLDWSDFFYTYIRGCRVFLLKDDMATLPQARKLYQKLNWLHQGLKTAAVLVVLRLSWFILSTVSSFTA